MLHMLLVAAGENDRLLDVGWKEVDVHVTVFMHYGLHRSQMPGSLPKQIDVPSSPP